MVTVNSPNRKYLENEAKNAFYMYFGLPGKCSAHWHSNSPSKVVKLYFYQVFNHLHLLILTNSLLVFFQASSTE